MSDLQASAALDPVRPGDSLCDPWRFWATCAWTVLVLIAWMAVQLIVVFCVLAFTGTWGELSAVDAGTLSSNALVLSSVAIIAGAAEIGVVAFAIRRARCRFTEYLALVWPSRTYLWIGLACLVVLLPLGDVSSWLTGRAVVPPFVVDAYRSARESGTIVLFAIALVVAAPLAEEIVFRGFMFRGLAASRVGIAGAILIPSAIWSAMHVQYETFFIVQIFILGVVFAWLRWRSGSLWLTITLHAIVNFTSLLQTVYFVHKMT
jgi:membrane protease YdiL (CAAX protease family)